MKWTARVMAFRELEVCTRVSRNYRAFTSHTEVPEKPRLASPI